jgi:hypothetical protein
VERRRYQQLTLRAFITCNCNVLPVQEIVAFGDAFIEAGDQNKQADEERVKAIERKKKKAIRDKKEAELKAKRKAAKEAAKAAKEKGGAVAKVRHILTPPGRFLAYCVHCLTALCYLAESRPR